MQQAADALQVSENAASAPAGVLRVQVEEKGFKAGDLIWSGSFGLLSAANQLVMVLFLTFFMLLSDQLFKRKLVEIVGTRPSRLVACAISGTSGSGSFLGARRARFR